MLDLKYVKENLDKYRDVLRKRYNDFPIEKLLELDSKRRGILKERQELEHQRNISSSTIASLKKDGMDVMSERVDSQVESIKAAGNRIKELEGLYRSTEAEMSRLALRMPNILHESVPEGRDESSDVEIRRWGSVGSTGIDHIEIGARLDLIDTDRAAKVSGARFFYLQGDLVRLNYALLNYALDFGYNKGYRLLQPPYMLKSAVIQGATDLTAFEDSIYRIQGEDLNLLATAEHAILGYHYDEILDSDQLPLKYLGISACFRKEAGAHGRDTKGIFRVHQFEKVEQFIFSKPEDSWKLHEELIGNVEELFQSLELPYRVINLCGGNLGLPSAKTYDLEVWLPGQNKFREAASCSNCLDWQARRAKIRYREGGHNHLLHTLNSTLVANTRALIAIMENNLIEDRAIRVPKVLRPYMGGQEVIEKKEQHK